MRAWWWTSAGLAAVLGGCAPTGGGAGGAADRPAKTASSAAGSAAEQAPGEQSAEAKGPIAALAPLADAIEKAATVDVLRRRYVKQLPAPSPGSEAALRGVIDDPEAALTTRLAATVAVGALAPSERALAIRAWLNEAIKQPSSNARRTSDLAVRLLTVLHPPLAEARARLPAATAARLLPTTPGERAAWKGAMAGEPPPAPTEADLPLLARMALYHDPASPRMAWLMLAPIDAASVTEALLTLPAADLGEPRPGPGLSGWSLALHATLPGARERLREAMATPDRAGDRATAALTWLGDPAAREPAAKLLDRLAQQGGSEGERTPGFDLVGFIEGAGRLARDEAEGEAGPLGLALARYGEAGADLSRRAHVLAGPAGVAADREALFDRLMAVPNDPRARRALLPLLRAEDGPRLAKLLAEPRWAMAGFFHHVRMVQQAPKAVLTPAVAAALVAVAGKHPDEQTREWAIGALEKANGPLSAVVQKAAAAGSKAGVRTVVMRSTDPWAELESRITGEDDPVRRAAYEMLIAPRLLPFEPTAEQSAQVLDAIARHITARPEEPWLFLRAARHYVERAKPALTPARERALARALRPYCVTAGPSDKPWWDALFAVGSLSHPDARATVLDAVKSVPTAGGRAVMRERLGLPADPTDKAAPAPPSPEKRGGHWANPAAPGGGR